jgi:hypothetical protein
MAKRKKEELITRKEKIVDAIDEFAKKGKEFIVYDNDSSFTLIVDGKAAVVSDYETIRGIAGIAGIYDLTPGCKRRKGKRVENSSDKVPGDITPFFAEWKKKSIYEVYVSGLSLPYGARIVKVSKVCSSSQFGGVSEPMASVLQEFGSSKCESIEHPIIASAEGITFVAMPMRIPEAEMERAIKDMERLVG